MRSGEASGIGWSRNMLYLGFNTLPRSVVRRQTRFAARITRTLCGFKIWLTESTDMAKRKPKSPKRKSRAKPKYQVFVSHATADKWIATTFCEKIDATGASSFRDDRDINGGDSIPEAIRTEIQVSRELVVLLTPDSIERPWVLLEVGAAWGRRKDYRIVPVLCHVSFDAIPDIIEGKKAFHINDFDKYLGELKRRVTK